MPSSFRAVDGDLVLTRLVHDKERPFRLRQGILMQLHAKALEGIHLLAGTFRNGPAKIHGSNHEPPPAWRVADEVTDLCEYVNEHWASKSPLHLSAYVLWRLNWVHPYADGNGRTARAASYVVSSIKLNSILPGTKTIPDQISEDKTPYYKALEAADSSWKQKEVVDVSELEAMLDRLLAAQLLQAVKEAGQEGT